MNAIQARRGILSTTTLRFLHVQNPQSSADLVKFGDGCVNTISPMPNINNQTIAKGRYIDIVPSLFDTPFIELNVSYARMFGGGNVR